MNDSLKIQLFENLQLLNLESLTDPFLEYLLLLNKWNQAFNLTAVRDPSDMTSRHLMDSLCILSFLKGKHILDVGTGAGLPGIPLALARPDISFTLLDSNGKKIRFLREAKRTLRLDNVTIVESRAESYLPSKAFDTVTSRAFSSIVDLLTWTSHLIAQDGLWLAMKGIVPEHELMNLPFHWQAKHYQVPGCEAERCCILIQNMRSGG